MLFASFMDYEETLSRPDDIIPAKPRSMPSVVSTRIFDSSEGLHNDQEVPNIDSTIWESRQLSERFAVLETLMD